MTALTHLDGVHDDLKTLNSKAPPLPETVTVQVPEAHTGTPDTYLLLILPILLILLILVLILLILLTSTNTTSTAAAVLEPSVSLTSTRV